MAKACYYVEVHGRNASIFDFWEGARPMVDGFAGA